MAQYAVYQNKDPDTKATYPFLLEVHTPLLAGIGTTVVISLSAQSSSGRLAMRNLNPVLTIRKKPTCF